MKMTVKKLMGTDWMVACMIPKGNAMTCMLKEVEGGFNQKKFLGKEKTPPMEIMLLETEMRDWLVQGIVKMVREGK